MNSMYEDYEFENRINNLVWTISGNYNEEINISKENYISKDVAMYFAIMEGARHKYIDWDIIKKYIFSRVKDGYDLEVISTLIHIIFNRVIEENVVRERPGVEDIIKQSYKDIISNLAKIYNSDTIQKVKYTIILEQLGKHPNVDGYTRRIIKSLKKININQDLIDILKDIDNVYLEYFTTLDNIGQKNNFEYDYINDKEIDFDTFSDFMYEELYSDEIIENKISEISSSMIVESIGEKNIDKQNKLSNRILYVDKETAEKIYSKIEHYYGKSYINKENVKLLESKYCKGVHEGCRIHFTDGVLRSECNNIAQIKYATRQRENNISKFRDKAKIHRRNIKKLKENISRILIEENESSKVYSDYGNVCANRAWRISRSNNKKIFYKDIVNEKGKYVIDILLDGSGSQSRNQGNVATQAYIISKALIKANIPNRVVGFSSFMDYTILKRFRDYDDNEESCENIFDYFCTGNNRDGLAIKSICHKLINRNEENKILIVLSDGKPNDVKIGKDREKIIKGEMSYKGVVGIKDTANEVRKARNNNIKVLGVFTGKEDSIEVERLIYGKDFIYTKNIDKFSEIVSIYLKKIISN